MALMFDSIIISVCILREFLMLLDVYILLSPQE